MRDEASAVHRAATRALEEIGEPAVEPLVAALQDEDPVVRRIAAEVLGNLGDPRAVAPLAAASQDENSDVRRAAARALRQIGAPEALERGQH